jgi:long-chain acyl-CoA synthetase
MKHQTSLNAYIQQAIRDNWNNAAFSDYQGRIYTYSDVAKRIARLHIIFEHANIERGDKIALCSRNSSLWAISALAVITYGAVAVPILHDFKPDTIHHLVNHSDARILFADSNTLKNLNVDEMPNLEAGILINNFSLFVSRNEAASNADTNIEQLFAERYADFSANDVKYAEVAPDSLALINYTSGSTGFSKGVMLSERALWSNLQYCIDGLDFLYPGDRLLSMLPLAHMFGLMVEMIHPLAKGCHITFLARTPSPRIIMGALEEVKPKLIVAVPLIIEKIIKTRIFPMLEQPKMKFLLKLPIIKNVVYSRIKAKLIDAFGGNLLELILGGAGVNKDVEVFLRRIKFPCTVGYGMTECGPLISYCAWKQQREASCGRIVDRMEVRADSDNPAVTPGVLWVRGDNVMRGYYKNQEATDAVMRDGWMNTGDIANIDADGYIYIRGRDKNLILGPSGQNIYPEEIEQVLNNLPLVSESLVIDAGEGKLEALIHPDYDGAERQDLNDAQIEELMQQNIVKLNKQMPAYSKVSSMRIFKEEFEKTPKRSIKRFLYQHKA